MSTNEQNVSDQHHTRNQGRPHAMSSFRTLFQCPQLIDVRATRSKIYLLTLFGNLTINEAQGKLKRRPKTLSAKEVRQPPSPLPGGTAEVSIID